MRLLELGTGFDLLRIFLSRLQGGYCLRQTLCHEMAAETENDIAAQSLVHNAQREREPKVTQLEVCCMKTTIFMALLVVHE